MSADGVTVVVDAGARYGMHPSWADFGAELTYFAFEPDAQEAARLRQRAQRPGFEVIASALAKTDGERELYIMKHRGTSSFLEVDPQSEWFKVYRPEEGIVEGIMTVRTLSVDSFGRSRKVKIDFLKVDTEGTELDVLEGAEHQLAEHVLGIRVNVNFQACYKKQALFPEIHNYVIAHGFVLLNLDYFGRGVPRNSLFRNPNPLLPDNERYGTLIGTDGVWVKTCDRLLGGRRGEPEKVQFAVLKYAAFCFMNHAPDVAVDTLLTFIKDPGGGFSPNVSASPLFRLVRRMCAEFLGRWRAYPDTQWDICREMFRKIFGLELKGGHQYWELIQSL